MFSLFRLGLLSILHRQDLLLVILQMEEHSIIGQVVTPVNFLIQSQVFQQCMTLQRGEFHGQLCMTLQRF